ncbi:hypothetical protein BGY98DRAFT_113155 [Russula aff. rugulosa BPL654]|nr:hypothetical protein BGY98DRAFT_113155 [Russula aff. rugulosa BPL654]
MPIVVRSNGGATSAQPQSQQLSGFITHESQLTSLPSDVSGDDVHNAHEQRNAPLLTRGAYRIEKIRQAIAQYGVFGNIVESQLPLTQSRLTGSDSDSTRLYLNTNTPFSALVCGVQGSGKSHTVSVILENMSSSPCR